jgi:asparagine synthase (glutamine-hydrolysing)
MSVGIENRAPLLDYRIVEMAWKFPLDMKIRNGIAKWPLRQILHKYIPEQLIDRPKMGFGIPAEEWLRGPLKPWAMELLSPNSLSKDNFFDIGNVQYILNQHMEGKYNWQVVLWRLCAFQEWLKYR